MSRYIYDIETNGLLDQLDRIHSLVMTDLDTGQTLSYRGAQIEGGVHLLDTAAFRAGHNIIKFDEAALQKVYPWFRANREGVVFDTLIAARLIWPTLFDSDAQRVRSGKLPGKLTGSQGLEAWGYRLGEWKGDYSKEREAALRARHEEAGLPKPTAEEIVDYVWGTWNQSMQDYCEQDVRTNLALFRQIERKGYSPRALADEMDCAVLCQKIEANGFDFDEAAAGSLYAALLKVKDDLARQLKEFFGSWIERAGEVKTPSVRNAAQGYWGEETWTDLVGDPLGPECFTPSGAVKAAVKTTRGAVRRFVGYPYQPITVTEFNPTSRHHIANRLKTLYGWEPEEFTPEGQPKVDETVLQGLTFEAAPLLVDYFLVVKRLGQIGEGTQAWLRKSQNGRLHGSINTVGAVTRRGTHSNPNMGQVPSVKKAKDGTILTGREGGWGAECRALFHPPAGWFQVGTDASGLELRCLAHFMARWDDGDYGRILLGGDIHAANQTAAGLPTRDMAKTFIYGFLYGAGDEKIGSIVGGTKADGKRLKTTFLTSLPALGSLVKAVREKAVKTKTLIALDGGLLHVRHDHAALNTLLQSAGALICKKWGVLLERELVRRGYHHGRDFRFMAWVHDEYQIAARTEALAHEIGEVSKWAMSQTEAYYNFRCPLAAEFKVGRSWKDCH